MDADVTTGSKLVHIPVLALLIGQPCSACASADWAREFSRRNLEVVWSAKKPCFTCYN